MYQQGTYFSGQIYENNLFIYLFIYLYISSIQSSRVSHTE